MTVDQLPIPDFLTKSFFEKALRNGFNNPAINIYKLTITNGSTAGDNYCSEIYRAKIVYGHSGAKGIKISLIVKAMPYQEHRGPVLEDLNVFDKEVHMYTKMIPEMSKLLNDEYLCAKCFYATQDPVHLIVFEDLKPLGYVMADRHNGLDEAHCRLVLNKLGKFHAASMALYERDPKSMDKFSFGMIKPNATRTELLEAIFARGLETFVSVVETWPGQEKLVKKLKAAEINYLKKLQNLTSNTPCEYKVLNHGDFWVNNYMFKYEEGKPVDVIFVDFQLCFFSSPGIDLNYFLNTSPRTDVRENKLDDILDGYYRNFSSVLSDLNHKNIPCKATFKKELLNREFYGFMAAVGVLPIVLLDKEASKDSNLEAMGDEDAGAKLRNAMYFGDNFQSAMKSLLPLFDRNNVLDKLKDL